MGRKQKKRSSEYSLHKVGGKAHLSTETRKGSSGGVEEKRGLGKLFS